MHKLSKRLHLAVQMKTHLIPRQDQLQVYLERITCFSWILGCRVYSLRGNTWVEPSLYMELQRRSSWDLLTWKTGWGCIKHSFWGEGQKWTNEDNLFKSLFNSSRISRFCEVEESKTAIYQKPKLTEAAILLNIKNIHKMSCQYTNSTL